ncbi:hypothetical protein OJAV_G00142230 [Oryzias javanicus]|uniref:Uncharacterized protein n=1 Tax=Oryzias javanicus TaxID=123683 RepID=A0A3S2MPC8_ORYJA|nr:hypothetical protein OJAV_G00142230 [Oryzias javanicus]
MHPKAFCCPTNDDNMAALKNSVLALKERGQNIRNTPSPDSQIPKKEENLHSTHSFVWSFNSKATNNTCGEAGTIENSLKNSPKFIKLAEKKKNRELVIVQGEKVKLALKKDGRFLRSIFKRNFVLSCTSTGVQTELSNLIDDLNDKTFQIVLLNKSDPPESESQPSSLDDAYHASSDSQSPVSDKENKKRRQVEREMSLRKVVEKDVYSKGMKNKMVLQFEDYLKTIKTETSELSSVPDLLHLEFGRNGLMCQEVKTWKKLMGLGDSVCQVRINGGPVGSGFLLFGSTLASFHKVVESPLSGIHREV